ncbi:hypothetical protein AG4045_027095, partial [Apium graveolens]
TFPFHFNLLFQNPLNLSLSFSVTVLTSFLLNLQICLQQWRFTSLSAISPSISSSLFSSSTHLSPPQILPLRLPHLSTSPLPPLPHHNLPTPLLPHLLPLHLPHPLPLLSLTLLQLPASPAPSPSNSTSPAPSPVSDGGVNHENQSTFDPDDEKTLSSSGMSGGQKAGVALGVIAGACVVIVGGVLYKKRQNNIRRSQFGYTSRVEMI